MLESYIEKKVVTRFKELGWLVRKLSWIGKIGAPDRILMRNGVCIFIEFKNIGEKPRASQIIEHKKMRAAGMRIYVIDNIENGIDLAETLTNEIPQKIRS